MPQTLEPPVVLDFEEFPNRIRWTRDECARLAEEGFLVGRYELIDGEIIRKIGQNPPHRIAVALVMAWLVGLYDPLQVQVQGPTDVASGDNRYNEPEPDVAVLARPTTEIMASNPQPSDILLVVEVSDTTLRFDRTTKLARYARAGFPEYWVLDINGRQLFVYRRPQADGTFAEEKTYRESETVAPLAKPEAVVAVSSLLPSMMAE